MKTVLSSYGTLRLTPSIRETHTSRRTHTQAEEHTHTHTPPDLSVLCVTEGSNCLHLQFCIEERHNLQAAGADNKPLSVISHTTPPPPPGWTATWPSHQAHSNGSSVNSTSPKAPGNHNWKHCKQWQHLVFQFRDPLHGQHGLRRYKYRRA